jgi:ABC-type Fe3+ transport system substrate-binding protein
MVILRGNVSAGRPRAQRRAILVLCVVSLSGAIGARADELYDRAKLEKTFVLYGAGPTGSYDHWIKDFGERYPGVTVSFTGGLSTALNEKIGEELKTNKMQGDLAILQTIQDFARWKKSGALLPFRPEGFNAIDPAYKDEDGAFTTVSVNAVTYAYNTNLIPSTEAPKSALDFLRPAFQSKLITTDPTVDDAALTTFSTIVEKYGWGYMDKYMAQKPTFTITGHATVSNAIASGEKLATFDSTTTTPQLQRQGKPIVAAFSQADKTPVFLVAAAIFKDAPHPNAAKLFLNWFLAPEQQSRSGAFSPRADVAAPPGFKPLASYNVDTRYRALLSDEGRAGELRARFASYIRPH